MARLTILTAAMIVALAIPAHAQSTAVSGQIGFGARLAPEYFGSEDYGPRPFGTGSLNALRVGPISFGDPDVFERPQGFGFRGSFRPVRAREAEDFPELTGLDDVDFSIELGGGLQYSADNFRAFAVARNGIVGHGAWVGEVGGDVILDLDRDTVFSVGPRLFFGSDDYASTYFGVTPQEAALSTFDAFDADGGLLSMGLEAQVDHRLNDDWTIRGRFRVSEFVNSAGDSPIVQQGNAVQGEVGVMLIRRFSFGF